MTPTMTRPESETASSAPTMTEARTIVSACPTRRFLYSSPPARAHARRGRPQEMYLASYYTNLRENQCNESTTIQQQRAGRRHVPPPAHRVHAENPLRKNKWLYSRKDANK